MSHTGTPLASQQHQQVKEEACAPVDGADAGHTFPVAHLIQQQSVSDLPGEHGWIAAFQMQDRLHHGRCAYFGFGASDHSWSDAPCLVVPEFTILIAVYSKGLPEFGIVNNRLHRKLHVNEVLSNQH